jgi:hypothetical protein
MILAAHEAFPCFSGSPVGIRREQVFYSMSIPLLVLEPTTLKGLNPVVIPSAHTISPMFAKLQRRTVQIHGLAAQHTARNMQGTFNKIAASMALAGERSLAIQNEARNLQAAFNALVASMSPVGHSLAIEAWNMEGAFIELAAFMSRFDL